MEYLVRLLVWIVLVSLISPSEISWKHRLEIVFYAIKRRFRKNEKPGANTPDQ